MTVTIDKFGRVLIPKPLRDRLGLRPGTSLELGLREAPGESAPTLELRPDLAETGLVRKGPLLVHRGRLSEAGFDAARLVRNQHEERARMHAGLDEPGLGEARHSEGRP